MNEARHGLGIRCGVAFLGASQWSEESFHEGKGSLQGNSDLRRCKGHPGSAPVTGRELRMWDSEKKASFFQCPDLGAVQCGDITVHYPEDSALPWPWGTACKVLKLYLGRDTVLCRAQASVDVEQH